MGIRDAPGNHNSHLFYTTVWGEAKDTPLRQIGEDIIEKPKFDAWATKKFQEIPLFSRFPVGCVRRVAASSGMNPNMQRHRTLRHKSCSPPWRLVFWRVARFLISLRFSGPGLASRASARFHLVNSTIQMLEADLQLRSVTARNRIQKVPGFTTFSSLMPSVD
jgi:hypothetical protein